MTEAKLSRTWGIVGLGWLGAALAEHLRALGIAVWGTHRDTFSLGRDPFPERDCEVLFLNTPPITSLPPSEFVAQIVLRDKTKLIFVSSTSVFGQEQGSCTEVTLPCPTTANGKWLGEVEERLKIQFSDRLLILRPGGLIGGDRHPVFSLSRAGQAKGGDEPVHLIHRKDLIEIIVTAEHSFVGNLINVVTPFHPTKSQYYSDWAQRLNLPPIQFSPSASSRRKIASTVLPDLYPNWICPRLDFL